MVHRCVEQIPSAYASLVVCFPMSLVEMLKGSDSLGKGGGGGPARTAQSPPNDDTTC